MKYSNKVDYKDYEEKRNMKNSISRRNFITKSAVGAGALSLGVMESSADNGQKSDVDANTSPREVLVQSVSHPKFTEDGNFENDVNAVIKTLERTSSYKPDIITMPEVFANQPDTAQEIPGPISNTFSKYAREHGCYVICGFYTKRNGKIYNSAVLIDRKGEISGIYDKIYPTEGECDKGVTPGGLTPPVFETDFGKIGMLICFDINWPDIWRSLREQGAEIVFWPSAYPNPHLLSAHARTFGYYVVGNSRTNPSYIFDGTGDMISMSGKYEPWAFARLNLEKIFCEIDFHVKKIKQIRKKYGRKVEIHYYHDSDWVTIESRSPDLTIKQLIDEYGLVSRYDYIKRADKYAAKFRP
jgi:predicted amidohydrolase